MDHDETLPASEAPASDSPDRLVRGAAIGRYLVLGTLGAGGMGIVYAAYDPELDRKIAVKLLRGRATDADARARIRREAQALARVNHANIVTVYDVGEHADGVFIAMELVDGGTLRTWQAKATWRAVLDAYIAAGRGLAAAHASGMVHRDFKPENVLVSGNDRVRVTDFGIARLAENTDARPDVTAPSGHAALTIEGTVMGTVGYMSPEQCDGAAVDARSDQYAWCVSVWEALYGARPYRGASLLEVAAAMSGPPPEIPSASPVPRSIGRALLRGLAQDPAARWPAMAPLLDATMPRRRRRRVAIAIGAAAIVAGLALVAATRPRAAEGVTCTPGASRLAGIWDDARRAQLAQRFGAAARSDVAATLRLVTHDFDAAATSWSAAWDRACTSEDRTHDPLLYAQRNNCLERMLVDFQGLVDADLEVEPLAFAAAWGGTSGITPIADCERVASIRATQPAPLGVDRAEIMQLIVDMHRARAAARAIVNGPRQQGNLAVPLARLDAIVERLDQLASPDAAEAAFWQQLFLTKARAKPDVIAAARARALGLARKYRNDRWLAEAEEVEVRRAAEAGDIAKARASLAAMDEAYERAGGAPALLDVHVDVEIADGRYAAALDAIRASRASSDPLDHLAPDNHSIEAIVIDLVLGRPADAVSEARRHLQFKVDQWRGDHWTVADAHEVLAHVLLYTGDVAGALAELHVCLAMHARIQAPPARMLSAEILALACEILLGLDAERDATGAWLAAAGEDPYTDAVELVPQWTPGALAWGLAHAKPSAELDKASSMGAYLVGDLATADRLAHRAPIAADDLDGRYLVAAMLDAREGHVDLAPLDRFIRSAKPVEHAAAVVSAAHVEAARGDWRAVRARLEADPLPILKLYSEDRAQLDALLGRALLETGEPARAIPLLERSLYVSINVLFSYKNANYLLADAWFALARALWGTDNGRARASAQLALSRYTSFQVQEHATVERWLADHR